MAPSGSYQEYAKASIDKTPNSIELWILVADHAAPIAFAKARHPRNARHTIQGSMNKEPMNA
ncbi:MAG: hypothetical protein MnENMB40S_36410 [Rhizobiaceae bacterium MnEN-MB40S]|nr:MAG: hypothetical protein MnENMB40S_36410 [Rhizobiaceae bacterium MnEN-MB40S]